MAQHFAPIIRRWPTVVAFAAEVGCPERSAREWLRTDSIPAAWFIATVEAAKKRGFEDITTEALALQAASRRQRRDDQANRAA